VRNLSHRVRLSHRGQAMKGPLRIIQVGAGFWGRSWAELTARGPGTRLAALVDASPRARAWAGESLRAPVFARLERALDSVEAGAVLLVSPPETHRSLAELSMVAGRHVVVEKPLAPALADVEALVDASRRAGLHVMAAQNYRFRRQSRALQRLVVTGALGDLVAIRIACRRDLRGVPFASRDWRVRMKHPYLLDMAIHHVDLLRQITGREVVAADARAWRVPDSPFRHEPTVEALLTLEGGVPVAYEGTWAATGPETSWNGDWELVGSKARATWTGGVRDPLRSTVSLERYGRARERVELPRLPSLDRLAVLHELRRAIVEGNEPECTAADNLRSLRAIMAIADSAERGAPVRL
jgi:predicted dehydrogenase